MNIFELVNELEMKWRSSLQFYSPITLRQYRFGQTQGTEADLSFDLEWGTKVIGFAGKVKANATPQACRQVLRCLGSLESNPVLITPYLSTGVVEHLESMQISGLDLNGNYYIVTPELVAVRLDQKNQYPSSRDIKKIFSSKSSIVSRFLMRENRTFAQVNDIASGIEACGGGISLSTISKVLKGLEDELMIDRSGGTIRVLQPDKILERLKRDYQRPSTNKQYKLRLPGDVSEMSKLLEGTLGRWVWSGETSAQRYATTTPETIRRAYTSGTIAGLEEYQDSKFYNCILELTNDDYVYFDADGFWASQIETYLSLSQLDKRDKQVADDIGQQILNEFRRG